MDTWDYFLSSDIFKIFVAVLLSFLGWFFVNYLSMKRDLKNKKREITTNHLINAFRVLAHEVSHRKMSNEKNRLFEGIISDIQLFGSIEQVKLAKELADECTHCNSFELDPLINSLRNDLRKELGLEKVEGNVKWLRKNKEDKRE